MTFNRITGSLLVLAGIIGFFTVADDLRHTGEFTGVASILFSGLLLLAGGFQHRRMRHLPVRWMTLGILAGIVIGAALDSILLGVAIGFTLGTLVGFVLLPDTGRNKDLRNDQQWK